MEINDIAHIVPIGGNSHIIYMKDGTVVNMNTDDGSIMSAYKLPTHDDINKALGETREARDWKAL